MTANLRTLTKEKRELPMTDTRIAAGNSAHLAARTKAFGVIPSQMTWGILAFCFIFLSSQLSHAGACNTVTGGSGFGVADNNTVLMLATTLTDNTGNAGTPPYNLCTSVEAVQANALGFNVEIDDAAAWGAKSTANFASYRAIVLGDPYCVSGTITEAENTTGTWGPAITGPVAVVGTDPEFHSINNIPPQSTTATQLTENAIAFATSTSGQPGAYISLSCYYFTSAANTSVPVLAPFGSFTVQGQAVVNDTATIVAPTNALVTTPNTLNDTGLSTWGESMHEAFNSFPSNFTEVVHSNDRNLPYILAGIPPQTQPVSTGTTTFYEFQNHAFGYTAQLNTGSPVNVTITPLLTDPTFCDTLVRKLASFTGTNLSHCFRYKNAKGGSDSAVMFELICPAPGNCTTPASFDAELGTNFDLTTEPDFNPLLPFAGWLKGDKGPDPAHPCTPNSDNTLFNSNQIDSYQPTRTDSPDPYTKGGSGGTGSCWVATYNQPDEVPPVPTITSPIGTYTLNQTVAANYSCPDPSTSTPNLPEGLSHPTGPYLTSVQASCLGPIPNGTNIDTSAAALGPHSFTVSAIDTGTNTASKSVNYSVRYQSSGLCDGDAGRQVLQPINPDGSSVFKGGSTIPVKFRVCDANGVSIGTPGVVTSNPFVCTITGNTGGQVDETVNSTTPDTNFRWDSTNQQWIFNWGTKGLLAGGKTYNCTITLNDATSIGFSLALK